MIALTEAAGTSGWDSFFNGRLKLGVQFLVPFAIALAVLIAISGLITRWTIRRDAEAWDRSPRWTWGVVGVLAILTAAVFVPLYPLFHPFSGGGWLRWVYGFGLVLPALLLLLFATRPSRDETHRLNFTERRQLPLPALVVLLCLWSILGSCFYFWGRGEQLLVAEFSLALFGVTATAMALGQGLRLQVEAHGPDGTLDAAASDYVLARIQQSDTRKANGLGISRSNDLSALITADFSAIPVGAIASVAARLMYAIRPGLTWRARVTVVDPNRLVVALTRNGLNVENIVISRKNMGLPDLPAGLVSPQLEAEQGRAHAQLLTGAAACILVRLSRIHTKLQDGLCGAEQWRGVAMQMIATEPALVEDTELELSLLQGAVELEPRYGTARLAYTYALYDRFQGRGPSKERLRFAAWMDRLVRLAEKGAPDRSTRMGWEVIRMKAMYSSVAMRWNYCLEELADNWDTRSLSKSGRDALSAAKLRVVKLVDYCDESGDGYAAWFAKRMSPFASNLAASINFLQTNLDGDFLVHWPGSAITEEYPWPALAFSFGCSASLVRDFGGAGREGTDLFDHFAFPVATNADRQRLLSDPAYLLLEEANNSDGLDVVLNPATTRVQLLDLPPFVACAPRLAQLGVTTVDALRQRTDTEFHRRTLAKYLDVAPLVVDYYADLAELAGVHPYLKDPRALKVLIEAGINSRHDLENRLDTNEADLLSQLRERAAEDGVGGLPAFIHPREWLINGRLNPPS